MGPLRRELLKQRKPIFSALTHADYAAAADCNPGASHAGERVQPFLIRARGNDLRIELRRGVEIVVVSGESCIRERLRLTFGQHPQRATRFHAEGAYTSDHFQYTRKRLAVRSVTPGGPQTKPRRALRSRRLGGSKSFVN